MRRIRHIDQETGRMPLINSQERKNGDIKLREIVSGIGRSAIAVGIIGIGFGALGLMTSDLTSNNAAIESKSLQDETNENVQFLLGGICLTAVGVGIDAVANSEKKNKI